MKLTYETLGDAAALGMTATDEEGVETAADDQAKADKEDDGPVVEAEVVDEEKK